MPWLGVFGLSGCLGAIAVDPCQEHTDCKAGEVCDATGACVAGPLPEADAGPDATSDAAAGAAPDGGPPETADASPSPDAGGCRADEPGPPCNGCPEGTVVPDGYVCLPAGRFTMGSPEGEVGRYPSERAHEVTLTRPLFVKRTEVTQAEWRGVMDSSPAQFAGCGPDCPVDSVNWFEAATYANRLSDALGLPRCHDLRNCVGTPGSGCPDAVFCEVDYHCDDPPPASPDCAGYRLPTEAEWEYAARAGTETSTYAGDVAIVGDPADSNNAPGLDPIAWYGGNSGVSYEGAYDCSEIPFRAVAAPRCGPHPVGGLDANAFGVHDMLGNQWEWTGDRFAEYPDGPVTDPTGPPAGEGVVRGGAWGNLARFQRSAHRGVSGRGFGNIDIGFRVVRSVVP